MAVIHDLKVFYLFLYNLFQWIGFSYIFITIMYRYGVYGTGRYNLTSVHYLTYFIEHTCCSAVVDVT